MVTLFLKLVLAHIIGDFVLQPASWVQKRSEQVGVLFLHVLVHALLLLLVFIHQLPVSGALITFIAVSHLAIDSLKIWWEKKFRSNPTVLFVIDQLLHLGVLWAVVCYTYKLTIDWSQVLLTNRMLIYSIAFLLVAAVSPIFLRLLFSKWSTELEVHTKRKDSLIDAGMLIGIMERLIIVWFIQVGFLSGIGFLLAAKSIFRFGDLSNAKDTKFTEYILVGTLASFSIAIGIGYALQYVLRWV